MIVSKDTRIRPRTLICSLIAALALMAGVGAAPALAEAPRWDILSRAAPTYVQPGKKAEIVAQIINLGDAPVVATKAAPVQISDTLSPGLVATGPMEGYAGRGDNFNGGAAEVALSHCETLPTLRCTYEGSLPPYVAIDVVIPVEAEQIPGEEVRLAHNELKVEGANAPPKTAASAIQVNPAETPFGVERYELRPEEEDGSPALQAGSHPFQMTTTIAFNQTVGLSPEHVLEKTPREFPAQPALLRNLNTTLPAGLVADTKASVFPRCSETDFTSERGGNSNTCPADTAIGAAIVTFKEPKFFPRSTAAIPVFNLVPEEAEAGRPGSGEPARFGFEFEKVPVVLDTSLVPGKGYSVEVKSKNSSQAAEVMSAIITVWGVPGAPQHDGSRGWECLAGGDYTEGLTPRPPCPAGPSSTPPYLILPTTSCTQPLITSVQAQSWQPGAQLVPEGGLAGETETLQGCEGLPFEPSMAAQPDQHQASTPTGFNVEVNVPQTTTLAASGRAEADIKDTTVELPEGMLASPGAANGLGVCSTGALGSEGAPGLGEQLENDHFTAFEANCPSASKVGTVNIRSPLLEGEITGSVYFSNQDTNPFTSPLVLYIVAEEPKSNVRIKLAGAVTINPTNGQLVSVFNDAPPLPFETLKLHLFNGPRASQSTPAHCRTYETRATFVPASEEPAAVRSSNFETVPNSDGQPCPGSGPLPFAPTFQAGTTNNHAGEFSPFTLTIKKPDGDAALESITTQLPPGLAAKISAVTPCANPQAIATVTETAPPCGPESLIGHTTSVSGLGGSPVTLPGNLYLTKGLDGAPFGLLASTKAETGPFNLGYINILSTITVNEETAVVTTKTVTQIPQFIKGVPAQLKEVNVTVERPGNAPFQFNPTNCSPMSVTGTLGGWEGTSEVLSSPFQASSCASLGFKPDFKAYTTGHTSKEGGASLRVVINYPQAYSYYSNIAKSVTYLPYDLPSRLKPTIQHACPDYDFNPNALQKCDPDSLVGNAIVHSPIFKNPLTGPAYLVSHANRSFPDVDIILTEPESGVKIVLDGHTDIKKGITKTTFESVPDAPVETFELILPEGPHSALAANGNLCKETKTVTKTEHVTRKVNGKVKHLTVKVKQTVPEALVLPTTLTAQNGAVIEQQTPIIVEGCPKAKVKAFKKKKVVAKKKK